MVRSDIRFLVVGVAMLAAAGLSIALEPSPVPAERRPHLESMIPASFGDWQIDPSLAPIPPSPDVKEKLDQIYDQLVSRTYVNGAGQRIMLVVAYGGQQADTLKAHRQEVCYAAQGFQINALTSAVLDLGHSRIPVTRMVAVAGARSEPVTYWFTMGSRVVQGRAERLIVQLRYGLSGEIPDGLLVRVSSLSKGAEGEYRNHVAFLAALFAAMRPSDAARLAGTGSG